MSEPKPQTRRHQYEKGEFESASQVARQLAMQGGVTIIGHPPASTSVSTGSASGVEMNIVEQVNPSKAADPQEQDQAAMTRDELKAHLEANEARVEQMTDRVEQRLKGIDEKMDARLGQIEEIDQRMEEREEKLFERVRSTLESMRAGREEAIGELREEIGELRGDFQSVKAIGEANFRNRRIVIGGAILFIALIQVLVAVFLV